MQGDGHDPVQQAYDVAYEHLAPVMVRVARDLAVDLRAEGGSTPVLFLGRDGHSLALATSQLDPELMAGRGREVVLSRAITEAALQDAERDGADFGLHATFRSAAAKVPPQAIDGAFARLERYLQYAGIRLGHPSSRVTLVDSSLKGTIQEHLAALWPDTDFTGRYAWFSASPHDPHPGTKTGYLVHELHGDGLPTFGEPASPREALSHAEAVGLIEDSLHGHLSSAAELRDGRPVQHPVGAGQISVLRAAVSSRYRDATVRDESMKAMLIAVRDRAVHARADHLAGRPDGLDDADKAFADVAYAWIRRLPVPPAFQEVADSFVRRRTKPTTGRARRTTTAGFTTLEPHRRPPPPQIPPPSPGRGPRRAR